MAEPTTIGFNLRLPFARKDAAERFSEMLEVAIADVRRHDDLCSDLQCERRRLRFELVLILDQLMVVHGGDSLFEVDPLAELQ